MIEQIRLRQSSDDVVLNCFSPTVVFSQDAPSDIAKSNSAVIQSATGLSTLDFAFSKTQRPAGGAFLGGGRTADREIVLTIRPNNIYDAKTLLNQMMGGQHRSKTSIYVLYASEWYSGSGYISKIEGALFDKDLDIKITYTMGDPLFYASNVDLDYQGQWVNGGTVYTVDIYPYKNSQVLYQSPVAITLFFNSPKEQLAQLDELIITGTDESTPFIKYTFKQEDASKWVEKVPNTGDSVRFVLNCHEKLVFWAPKSLNYAGNTNLVQRSDKSLRFPYIYLVSDRIKIRCEFRAELSSKNMGVGAYYVKTRSGF